MTLPKHGHNKPEEGCKSCAFLCFSFFFTFRRTFVIENIHTSHVINPSLVLITMTSFKGRYGMRTHSNASPWGKAIPLANPSLVDRTSLIGASATAQSFPYVFLPQEPKSHLPVGLGHLFCINKNSVSRSPRRLILGGERDPMTPCCSTPAVQFVNYK